HAIATVAAIGDLNGDGHVDAADILPMEQALADAGGYESAHDNLADWKLKLIGDVNHDSQFNNADLQFLLTTLRNGGGSDNFVPEPSGIVLAALGLASLTVLCRSFRGIRRTLVFGMFSIGVALAANHASAQRFIPGDMNLDGRV